MYLIQRAAPSWSQEAYFKASNPDGGDFFGYSVALSSDGSTLAVSEPEQKPEDVSAVKTPDDVLGAPSP